MKENVVVKENKKGITLIALMITVIVLLILAGVTLSLTLGERGIFKTAKDASLNSRGANVRDQVELWKMDEEVDKQTGIKSNKMTEKELLDDLELNQKILTNEERNKLETERTVQIGNQVIILEEIEKINFTILLKTTLNEKNYVGNFKCSTKKNANGNSYRNLLDVQIRNDNSPLIFSFWGFRSMTVDCCYQITDDGSACDFSSNIGDLSYSLIDGEVIEITGHFSGTVVNPSDLTNLGFTEIDSY